MSWTDRLNAVAPRLRFDPAHPKNAGHPLWHARGRNLAGNPVQP